MLRSYIVLCLISMATLATVAPAAVYREGKAVMERDCKVAIVKMKWGKKGESTDRIIGTARLYVAEADLSNYVTLTFDAFNNKAEKVKSFDVQFNLLKYGYRMMRAYAEGEFCVDFAHPEGAITLTLVNVKYESAPVTYKTLFNISGKLQQTSFRLPEPKVRAVRR
jgi:hypothetical protein